jgi:competence protein ComEC
MTAPAAERRLDLRLVPAAATGWAATAATTLWSVGPALVATSVAIAATAAAAWWANGRADAAGALRAAGAALTAVAAVGAAFTCAAALRTHDVRHHPIVERYGHTAVVTVTPSETPRSLGAGRMLFRADLRTVDDRPMSGRVVVFASVSGFADLTAGRPARFRARIGAPTRRDLTVALLSASGTATLGEASSVQRTAHQIRAGFAAAARAVLPAEQAAMLPALVLGDTSAVPARITDEFRAAGLTHLTAVSGANVTIVCGAVLLSAGVLGPRVAVLLAALALTAFVVVVQPSASVLRAAVMGAITLVAIVSHRRRHAVPALAGSVLVLLIGAPELAVDAGFALSVSATAALIVLAPRWSRRLVARGWPKPLADAVSIAVAAQLVTAPLVAGISGTVSLVSIAANLAVTAVIAPITVFGTAAAALCPLWPAGGQLLIRFTGPELWWLLGVARWAAGVPGAAVAVPSGLLGVATVGAGGLSLLVLWRLRWVRIGVAGLAVCLLAWTIAGQGAAGVRAA